MDGEHDSKKLGLFMPFSSRCRYVIVGGIRGACSGLGMDSRVSGTEVNVRGARVLDLPHMPFFEFLASEKRVNVCVSWGQLLGGSLLVGWDGALVGIRVFASGCCPVLFAWHIWGRVCTVLGLARVSVLSMGVD